LNISQKLAEMAKEDLYPIDGFCCTNRVNAEVPVPGADLSHSFRDGYAERRIAVEYGDTYLDLGDLTIEFPRHEPLVQKCYTVHPCLDAASAVVSAPSSPKRPAQVFRRALGLVSRRGSCGDGLPRLRVLAGRDNGMGAAVCNGVVAFACVVGTVGGDAADPLVRRDLTEKVPQGASLRSVS
jgi:hypothetical protein